MPVPNHGISCITKAFQTHCPDCGDDVWFFKCNCGSKVYFQYLGWPWDQHICRDRVLREALQLVRLSDRLSDDDIYKRIDLFAKERKWDIPPEMAELLDNELGKRKYPLKVISDIDLTPYSDISGKVMNINRDVSFSRRFNININNPLQKGLAGVLITQSYSEVLIRELPNKQNECKEFVVYVERGYLRQNPILLTQTILASIRPMKTRFANLWEITNHKCY